MKRTKAIFKFILKASLTLIIIALMASSIYNRSGNCTIEGNVDGLGTRPAIVSGWNHSNNYRYFKVIMIINDKFSFKVKTDKTAGGRIISWNMLFKRKSGKPLGMRSKRIDFEIKKEQKICIEGTFKKYSICYETTGNRYSSQLSHFRNQNLNILEKETKLALMTDSLRFYQNNPVLLDSLENEFNKTREQYTYRRYKYAINNPNNELSAEFLGMQHKDTIRKYISTLSKNVLETLEGQQLQKRVLKYNQMDIGQIAPNIIDSLRNFNLSELKGKYVVLDFWGTSCGGCRLGMPKMRKYYKTYRNKIEFVGIAYNDKRPDWEAYIKAEKLDWIQLFNDKKLEKHTNRYYINIYPTKILLGKDGKILKIFEGEKKEFYEFIDALMSEDKIISTQS